MKKIIISVSLLVLFCTVTYAQCGQKGILTASKTEYLDPNGEVERTVDEKTVIEITKSDVTITLPERVMTATIKSDSCNWKEPFKEGKSIIKGTLTDGQGDVKNVTFIIEGKDGKVNFLAQLDEMPDRRIRVIADKFEEKK